MASLNDQVIAVTGGNSGIGLGSVLVLVERGATVWVCDLGDEPAPGLRPWIQSGHVHFRGGVDVASRAECTRFMDEVVRESSGGRLDGLLNNAGIGLFEGPIASDENFTRMMEVNVRGTWNFATYAFQAMQRQEPRGKWRSRGNIVNISSQAGIKGFPGLAAYCATKHAVIGLTRAWSQDFSGHGIRVNAISPGIIETPALLDRVRDEAGFIDTMPKVPMGRFGQTEEIGTTVAFLLSDDSSHITGQVIPVTGGVTPF